MVDEQPTNNLGSERFEFWVFPDLSLELTLCINKRLLLPTKCSRERLQNLQYFMRKPMQFFWFSFRETLLLQDMKKEKTTQDFLYIKNIELFLSLYNISLSTNLLFLKSDTGSVFKKSDSTRSYFTNVYSM